MKAAGTKSVSKKSIILNADIVTLILNEVLMTKSVLLSPSILSADLLKLKEQVSIAIDNGADFIHVDVMDGHYVPNLTFGPVIVKTLKKFVDIPLDVHLMIENADAYIPDFAESGADIITVHQEACTHLDRTVQLIHSYGKKAGVSLNPATSIRTLEDILPNIELVLIMTVNPGFGNQLFIENSLKKIANTRRMIAQSGKPILLEVDGGINTKTIASVVNSGADVLVAGNAVFGQNDIAQAMKDLRTAIDSTEITRV